MSMPRLHHHPHTRAATVVWALEEVGVPYELVPVRLSAGEHKSPERLGLNPMGKLPILEDAGVVVTETAACCLFLADRYAPGRLAPALDDPARGPYLRWSFFGPSVVEPGAMARRASWAYPESAAGWGSFEAVLTAVEAAIGEGPYLLGERFSMADVAFGSTLRYMLAFGMLDKKQVFVDYVARLDARPAFAAAQAVNARALAALG
jgi:glutathione S-transferase